MRGPAIDGGGGVGGCNVVGETHSCRLRRAWGSLWINVRERSAVLGISERTDCMLGSVSLEGTPCIGRARDRNGGRVGRSGTKEDMGPQRVGVDVDVEGGGEQTGEIEMAWETSKGAL